MKHLLKRRLIIYPGETVCKPLHLRTLLDFKESKRGITDTNTPISLAGYQWDKKNSH